MSGCYHPDAFQVWAAGFGAVQDGLRPGPLVLRGVRRTPWDVDEW